MQTLKFNKFIPEDSLNDGWNKLGSGDAEKNTEYIKAKNKFLKAFLQQKVKDHSQTEEQTHVLYNFHHYLAITFFISIDTPEIKWTNICGLYVRILKVNEQKLNKKSFP